MTTVTSSIVSPTQRALADALQHLAGWLDHHLHLRPAVPVRPARLTYLSSAPCPACGDPLRGSEDAVELRGELYHEGCALYQPRRRAGADSKR